MLIKQKISSLPRNLALGTFGKKDNVLDKGKSAITPLLNRPEVLSSGSDKARLFAKNFSKHLMTQVSLYLLPVSPSRNNLKQHNIFVTPKKFKKVTTSLDLSKVSASNPDCIPVVVLKNCA